MILQQDIGKYTVSENVTINLDNWTADYKNLVSIQDNETREFVHFEGNTKSINATEWKEARKSQSGIIEFCDNLFETRRNIRKLKLNILPD